MSLLTDTPIIMDDLAIIQELKKMPAGAQIAEDGPLGFLYSQIGGGGQTYVYSYGKRLQVIYIDHDDVISSIKPDKAQFAIEKQETSLLMNVIVPYCDDIITLNFSFNFTSRSGMDTLRQIASQKKIHMNFISIEYGNLVKSFHAPLKLPKTLLKQIR